MSKHLFGIVVTPYGTAANNRGATEGNITTLQKILWKNEVHTTVSAEAIRWAIRYAWQSAGIAVNRKWDEEKSDHEWQDQKWLAWTSPDCKDKPSFIDDDVLGFMLAEAGKTEGNDAEADDGGGKKKKAPRVKGTCDKRRGVLEVTRALSLTPFAGDITFNAKSGEKGSTSLYGTEVHATRYQYGFAMTPGLLREQSRVISVVDALVSLAEVAGNQSRFLFDFSPETIIFRWTDDFSPRMLYGFGLDAAGGLTVPDLLRRVESGDVKASELVVGGSLAETPDGKKLENAGAFVKGGVLAAATEMKNRIKADMGL